MAAERPASALRSSVLIAPLEQRARQDALLASIDTALHMSAATHASIDEIVGGILGPKASAGELERMQNLVREICERAAIRGRTVDRIVLPSIGAVAPPMVRRTTGIAH